jgi:hypothetical protein
MRLINTIEIRPYDFATAEYEYPKGDSAEERDEFWIKCISDKNLGRLKAIEKGSYLVDIRTINDDELAEILKHQLRDVELSEFEEQIGIISGGIVLEENGVIYITPNCCGDIGNIEGWERIFEKRLSEWSQLWIGHPWIYYRNNNGLIEFSDHTESSLEDLKDIKVLIGISEVDLQRKVAGIRKQQDHFEYSIRKALDKMGIENAERISKLMTGNL